MVGYLKFMGRRKLDKERFTVVDKIDILISNRGSASKKDAESTR